MRRLLVTLLATALMLPMPMMAVQAQAAGSDTANVVVACGTPNSTYSAGANRPLTQGTDGQVCVNGALTVTPASGTVVSSAALAANLVVKNSAAKLIGFNISADSTLSAAAWWVMIYNATSAPGDGAVTPAKCYAASSGTTSMSGAFSAPDTFSTGITIGVSTTGCFTKTASTHAFISGDYE